MKLVWRQKLGSGSDFREDDEKREEDEPVAIFTSRVFASHVAFDDDLWR